MKTLFTLLLTMIMAAPTAWASAFMPYPGEENTEYEEEFLSESDSSIEFIFSGTTGGDTDGPQALLPALSIRWNPTITYALTTYHKRPYTLTGKIPPYLLFCSLKLCA